MARNALGIALVTATCWFADAAMAQTSATNPQRPARGVESTVPLRRIKAEATKLDSLLATGLQRRREEPLPVVDDATFLRRSYLNIVGRIPTLQETEAFLADQEPQKRDLLCDRLLDSQGRTSHFANFWFDLLRVKSRQRQLNGEPFAHFLRESIQQDKPYDQLVRELLTADGAAHESGHGATGYLLRDMNMPHDAMANTLRIFLGTRLECAQCHNHPFDTWTQKEFYEMAAFFGGIRYRTDEQMKTLAGARTLLANADDRTKAQARNLLQRMSQGISGTGTGVERLPDDYKYDDQKPQSPILANTIFGADVKLKYPADTRPGKRPTPRAAKGRGERAPEANSRAALADWMTSKKNPRFTKMIVNRMWARTFGKGLIEPLDDWKKDTEAVHPELFEQLEKLLIDLDYDLRQFERVLVHMHLFQRATPSEDPATDVPYAFAGPLGHRLSAEQLWDSLLTLVYDDIDERLRPLDARAKEAYDQYEELKTATPEQIVAMVEERRNPGKMSREQMQDQRENARRQLAADAELQKRAQPLLRELAMARRQGDLKRIAEIAQQLQAAGFDLGQRSARGREDGQMLRASDLTQPAPANHPLHVFGQSDRETIDAASTAATVPQVLTMLNGFLDQKVLEGASALKRDLETAPNGERRVRIAFLTVLNREPSPDEVKVWRRAIAIDGEAVIRDLVWVLCNSNEFRFAR
ncbi:MAG: DUF1549 domain-containing protein [Planctomycetes bacterium]|nr:DUF1549 domain-containing protein [Planctomycetota bacterium]